MGMHYYYQRDFLLPQQLLTTFIMLKQESVPPLSLPPSQLSSHTNNFTMFIHWRVQRFRILRSIKTLLSSDISQVLSQWNNVSARSWVNEIIISLTQDLADIWWSHVRRRTYLWGMSVAVYIVLCITSSIFTHYTQTHGQSNTFMYVHKYHVIMSCRPHMETHTDVILRTVIRYPLTYLLRH